MPKLNITEPDYYKMAMQDLMKRQGLQFEGVRNDTSRPFPIEMDRMLKGMSLVVKVKDPSAGIPVRKMTDFGSRRMVEKFKFNSATGKWEEA